MNIAIFGLGTIGTGVYELVNKLNSDIYVKKIFDKPEKKEIYGDLYEGDVDKIVPVYTLLFLVYILQYSAL